MNIYHSFQRLGRTVLMLTLAICLMGAELTPALAVTQGDIDRLKNESKELDRKREELENQLKALTNDKTQVLAQRKQLDEKIFNTAAKIENMEAQIAAYQALIKEAEAELAELERQEQERYELFCKRVRVMEEQGETSYWSVLFGASSFTDLLTRLNDINQVMENDQQMIDNLQILQAEISEQKAELMEKHTESEAAMAELVIKKEELDRQRQEAVALVNKIKSNEKEYETTLKKLDEEEENIQKRIVQLSRELAAQQAAQGKPKQSSSGGYIWPVDSRYITSTVGGRASPGGVGSTNHKGTDIGRVGYNSSVYAAKSGTVIVSQYSNSYGNYVVVSHGSGNTTLYAHLSKRKVEEGDYVKQGAVLGITGSTGNSTGPHLHFEITENGVRINPLSHGKAPCKGYLSGYTLSKSGVSK